MGRALGGFLGTGLTTRSAHSRCLSSRPGPLARPQRPPADEGRSSHTRLVSGVRRLQSPSECTEETEGGRSPDARPGAGDLAFRLLGLPETWAFPPQPAGGHTEGAALDCEDSSCAVGIWG